MTDSPTDSPTEPPTPPPAEGSEAQMATADGARWRGHTHEQLYAMIHEGPGAAASAEPARRWQEIASNLNEIGQDLRKTLEQTGASWTGKAASGAYDRLILTATWATETSESAAQMRTAVENQGDFLAKARADMPPPQDAPAAQPDPAVVPAVQVAQAQTDLEAPESSASSAEERAFEVMTAYEQSTLANTTAMAAFAPPLELLRREEVKHGGGFQAQATRPAGLDHMPGPRHDDRPRHHGNHHWSSNTSGQSAPWTAEPAPREVPAARNTTPTGAPSAFTGGALPLRRESDKERPNKPAAPAANTNTVTGAPQTQPKAPLSSVALPQDLHQAAAASQAAATAQAGAPVAPATAAPTGVGQHDRMAMRRFGMEAIGSNQWFGDTEEPVVGESPKRRRDFREIEEITEAVSVLDEEHRLPPNVIGDGPSAR
ncbi:hypothetical protein BLA60_41570 [Actinophytocola xinjiangensis]|uniref:PPE domain-containing protein n=1 Tax=Actinophytocola xinjiangensis TaxID=485602 RepID=A0A7Z0WCK5_9PSEU|nr:PPE domain-containing protein [Actinophytocola xinjiangensis]OLF04287.1 hypothetical protein BLA60_41570 [Actinophytocola xinjiangensis]